VAFVYSFRGAGGVPATGNVPQEAQTVGPAEAPVPARVESAPPPVAAAAPAADPLRSRTLVSRVEVVAEGDPLALRVVLGDAGVHAAYRLTLENDRADAVWSSASLIAQPAGEGPAHVLEAALPPLAPGAYFLIVEGVSPSGPPETLDERRVTLPRR
jgi:hypothetical protein